MKQTNWDFLFGMLFILMAWITGTVNPALTVLPLGMVFVIFMVNILERLDVIIKELKEKKYEN